MVMTSPEQLLLALETRHSERWPHRVMLASSHYDPAKGTWCRARFGKDQYKHSPFTGAWHFREERDALMFLLRFA